MMEGITVKQRSPTKFEQEVYAATSCIPRGKVTTYSLLAKTIGCGSARAIGQALRRNPFAPKVPCHRVISSNLHIGGFSGKTSGPTIAKKIRLLAEEGVIFKNGYLADGSRVVDLRQRQP